MLIQLSPSQFAAAAPLLKELSIHLATCSILAGKTPAEIFVDDPAEPRIAAVWAGHRCLLSGSPGGDPGGDPGGFPAGDPALQLQLAEWLQTYFFPKAIARGDRGAGIYFAPDTWAEPLAGAVGGKEIYFTRREYFASRALPGTALPGTALPDPARQTEWQNKLPAGFSLVPVDAALLEDSGVHGLDELKDEMCSERPSVPDFLANSFGLAAVFDQQLAGWCLSEYNCGGECEIGIATMPAYRQRGLAVCMTEAFAEMALQHGIQRIGWHCYASNLASSATARRAGLEKICDYQAAVVIFS